MLNYRVLYRRHSGGVGRWRIWSEGRTIHIAHSTTIDGSEVRHTELVEQGLAGRSLSEQVLSRISSRISRMKDRGYKDTVEEASSNSTNQLGLLRPMLAQPLGKVTNANFNQSVLQRKLDGHRCLITKSDGVLVAYSRQGKVIDTIPHLLEQLQDVVPEGDTLDGELYLHGQPLQTLASWIKRYQPNTLKLNYICYDLMDDAPYTKRHLWLSQRMSLVDPKVVSGVVGLLDHVPFDGIETTMKMLTMVRSDGYEGLMLRLHNRAYEDGKRSSSLIKIKEFTDDEFECVDVVPSSLQWGICVLKAKNGSQFRVSAPGTLSEKTDVLTNRDKYIGRLLTVEYATLTTDGIPFHASAKCWHEVI